MDEYPNNTIEHILKLRYIDSCSYTQISNETGIHRKEVSAVCNSYCMNINEYCEAYRLNKVNEFITHHEKMQREKRLIPSRINYSVTAKDIDIIKKAISDAEKFVEINNEYKSLLEIYDEIKKDYPDTFKISYGTFRNYINKNTSYHPSSVRHRYLNSERSICNKIINHKN